MVIIEKARTKLRTLSLVEIKIVTTETDPYARYHGKSVDESLDSNFWDTQPDKRIPTSASGFTHTQTVELAEGSHYIIYGNSAASSYPWHAQIFVNDTLIAEGDVVRSNHLRGNFTITGPEPTGVIINAIVTPTKAGFLVWLQWLSPTGWMDIEAGTTDAAGKKTWLYSFTSYPQTVRIRLPAGQVVDGVEYGSYTSEQATLWDTQEADLYLYPQAVEPDPPVVDIIVISAPSSAEAGVTFQIVGYVLDQYGDPMGGVPVYLYDNGSHFATPTTGSNGYYFQNTSISLPGVHELAARADSKWAYKDITITEAAVAKGSIVSYDAPASAMPGDTVTVTAEAKNIGTATGTFRLRLIDRDLNVDVDASSWFTLAEGATSTKNLSGVMPDKDWNLRLDLEREIPTGVVIDDQKTFTAINIVNWWDAIKAWWNGLSGVQKGIILTTSIGGVIIGGASTLKKR